MNDCQDMSAAQLASSRSQCFEESFIAFLCKRDLETTDFEDSQLSTIQLCLYEFKLIQNYTRTLAPGKSYTKISTCFACHHQFAGGRLEEVLIGLSSVDPRQSSWGE